LLTNDCLLFFVFINIFSTIVDFKKNAKIFCQYNPKKYTYYSRMCIHIVIDNHKLEYVKLFIMLNKNISQFVYTCYDDVTHIYVYTPKRKWFRQRRTAVIDKSHIFWYK